MKRNLANILESVAPDRGAAPTVPTGSGPPPDEAKRWAGAGRLRGAWLALDSVSPDPDQPRREFDPEALARLAGSLRDRGQVQPIRVRWRDPVGWVIVSGERRWRAARMAGLDRIAAVEATGEGDPATTLAEQLTENCLREDLTAMEQARAYRTLMAAEGWSQRQLAEYLHVSQPTVSRVLSLLSLPPETAAAVESGAVGATAAYRAARDPSPPRPSAPPASRRQARTAYPVPGGRVTVHLDDPAADGPRFVEALRAALERAGGGN